MIGRPGVLSPAVAGSAALVRRLSVARQRRPTRFTGVILG
jgi:hypothetical protein